jgi:hypothetical protein
LGFDISERTVSRWVMGVNPDPARRWLAFLRNHREAFAAMDFFAVYCFFVIGHDRRKILHCKVTRQPDAFVDRIAAARSLGVRTATPVSDLRPRCQVLC